MKTAIELIIEERQRQNEVYGYSDEHILNHPEDYEDGELADAAACYATDPSQRDYFGNFTPLTFPWPDEYWKPTPENRIKELAKAGAMIVAEITRLQNIGD